MSYHYSGETLGVPAAFIVVTGIFVTIRLTSNFKRSKKLLFDDYIAAVAVVFFSITLGLTDLKLRKSEDLARKETHEEYRDRVLTSVRTDIAISVFFIASTVASKAPILLLYVRLFGVERWLRVCSYVTLITSTILLLASAIVIGAGFRPVFYALDRDADATLENCINITNPIWIASGILSLLVDIAIVVIPIPIITKLRLPIRKKVGIALVFASGIFAITATAISLYYKIKWEDLSTRIIWSSMEFCIAVMAGCVPAVNTFWNSTIVNSTLYLNIFRMLSHVSLRVFSRTPSSLGPSGSPGGRSTNHIINPMHWEERSSLEKSQTNPNSGTGLVTPLPEVPNSWLSISRESSRLSPNEEIEFGSGGMGLPASHQ